MAKQNAHKHTFDIHPKFPTSVACTICGFSAPAVILKSKVNLDAWTARQNCSQAVLDLLGINRDGTPQAPVCPYGICSNRTFNEPPCEDCLKAGGL